MIIHKLGTVKGRHEIKKVQEYVFESIPDPTDVKGTERMAYDRLSNLKRPCKVELYVTGLTMAVISVINAASALAVPITLMHYDRETGNYFPQELGYLHPFGKNDNLKEYETKKNKSKIRA